MSVVLIFVNDEFDVAIRCENEERAIGFAEGVEHGAGLTGGNVVAYAWPSWKAPLREQQDATEVEKAIAAAEKGDES